jgi:hypothetical protein
MTATISAPVASFPPRRAPGLLAEAEWEEKYGVKFSEYPQCFTRLPREAYDDLPGINASLTKEVTDKTPAHAKALFDPDREKVDNATWLIARPSNGTVMTSDTLSCQGMHQRGPQRSN